MICKLDNIASFQKGFAFKSKDYITQGVKIVKVSNLNKNLYDESKYVFLNPEDAHTYEKYELQEDDLVITTVGSWPNNPASIVGKVIRIPKELNGSLLNQNAVKIRTNSKCLQEYLYYALGNQFFFNYLIGTAQGSANQASITQKDIKNYEIDLPEIKIQSKIVEILNSIDKKIILNNKLNENLFKIAQHYYENLIIELDDELIVTTLGEICTVKGGKRLPKGVNLIPIPNTHPYIRVRDISDNVFVRLNDSFEYVDDETQKSIARYIVDTNDIIISIVGTIGLIAKVHKSLEQANLTENCVKLAEFQKVTSNYIYLFLVSKEGQNAIKKGAVGAVQSKLPIKNIKAIEIKIPTRDKLEQFEKWVEPLFATVANNVEQNSSLIKLRDTLLPKLMLGEIDLSEIQCEV